MCFPPLNEQDVLSARKESCCKRLMRRSLKCCHCLKPTTLTLCQKGTTLCPYVILPVMAKFHYCLSVITIATNLLCVHTCSWFPEPVYKLLSVLCLPASNHSIKTCLKLTVVLECLIVLFLFILSSSVCAGGHLGSGKQLLCQSFFAVQLSSTITSMFNV